MSKIFDQLLGVRGLSSDFLRPKYEDSLDPNLLPDMTKAVERIKQAADRGEKVLIYGDYDVDGVTASTALYDALKLVGIKEVEIMLPNRFLDGYGMSTKVVQKAAKTGVKLVITVDCGSRNQEIVAELNKNEVDTIVTDHHECGVTLPEAVAVVNPKRKDWLPEGTAVSLRDLAGVGVAFKVAQALVKAGLIPEGQEKWLLDLVLIGTVCDSMMLGGENRRLCYYGLKVLEKTRRPGLKELARIAGVKRLDSEAIGFQIGPRLNAAGRMETAEKALGLLMAQSRTEAVSLAMELEKLNTERKAQQQGALREIKERGLVPGQVIIEQGLWHEGVLGIIAGRLVEEYHKPAFVLSEVDGALKGSGRSFGEFNLAEALTVCEKYIIGGGGHAAACGVKVATEQLEAFREGMNRYYESLKLENQERFLGVNEDLAVEEFADLSLELIGELKQLEPYGEGNQEPVFLLPEVRVVEAAKLGAEEQHLRLQVWDKQGKGMKLIQFYAPEENLRVQPGMTVNAWITLNENDFRGTRSVEGRIVKLG